MIVADRQCPDDLLVRGWRHQVSELEQRALDAHLGQCASCRAASALAALFDAVPETLRGDRELLDRVSGRATREQGRLSTRRWTRAAAVAAAVVVLTGGVAVAWVTVGRRVVETRLAEKAAAPLPPRARVPHRAPVASREISAVAPTVEPFLAPPAHPEIAAPSLVKKRPESPRSVVAPTESHLTAPSESPVEPLAADHMQAGAARGIPETFAQATPPSQTMALPERRREDFRPLLPDARSLFAQANAVRRAGELGRAIGLYQTLRRDFPGSAQALLASVSVGDLLLRLGDPAGAIAAYDSYLEHASGGALTEEALFGRARCLASLGRAAEERQTWEDLVRRFPRSAYQPAASKRLGELKN